LAHEPDDYSQFSYDIHFYKSEGILEIDRPFILDGTHRDRRGRWVGGLREQRPELSGHAQDH
jgi:hypothetical protein